jgi:hypothetical protein
MSREQKKQTIKQRIAVLERVVGQMYINQKIVLERLSNDEEE